MVRRCIHDNCNKQPTFNLPTETKAIYCSEHKKPGMIDIKSKRCIHENCNIRPNFNLPDETKAIYCTEHKKPGMIDISRRDVFMIIVINSLHLIYRRNQRLYIARNIKNQV